MRPGSRLATDRATVSKAGITTDGPFGEAKEVVGGYWFVSAGSLREAADLLSHSPTLPCGLHYEVRPLDPEICTASANSRFSSISRASSIRSTLLSTSSTFFSPAPSSASTLDVVW